MDMQTNRKGVVGTFAFCLTATALNLTSAILAYIIATYSEIDPALVTSLLTIPSVVGTVFGFLSGGLVRQFGIRKFTLFVQTMQLISGMIFLFFGNKTSIWVLWGASACYGFTIGSQQLIPAELLRQTVPNEQRRGTLLGYGTSVMSLGGVFFATVGGAIAAAENGAHWERAYILYLLVVVCLIVEFLTLPKKQTAPAATAESGAENTKQKKRPLPVKVWLVAIHYCFFFLFLYAFSLNISDFIVNVHQLGTSVEAGLAISCLTVGGIVSGLAFGWYSRLLGRFTMPVMMALCMAGLAIVVCFPSVIMIYLAAILMGFAMMGSGPYAMMEMGRLASGDDYPRAAALMAGFTNVGMMIAVYVLAFLSGGLVSSGKTVADSQMLVALIGMVAVFVGAVLIYASPKRKER